MKNGHGPGFATSLDVRIKQRRIATSPALGRFSQLPCCCRPFCCTRTFHSYHTLLTAVLPGVFLFPSCMHTLPGRCLSLKLFVCEFCLKYMRKKPTLDRHRQKCPMRYVVRHNMRQILSSARFTIVLFFPLRCRDSFTILSFTGAYPLALNARCRASSPNRFFFSFCLAFFFCDG